MARDPSALIGSIYEAALDSGAWAEVLTRIADRSGAANAAVVVVDPRIGLSNVVTPRADPDIVQAYGRFWWQHDPTAAATHAIPPGVVTDLSVTGRERYFSSAFQNDFWARSGLGAERLASNLYCDGPAFGSFVLQTAPGRDEITAEMRRCLAQVLPHLLRAVQTQRRLHQIERAVLCHGCPPCEGLLLVDRGGRVIWADPEGEAMLAEAAALRLRDGRLDLAEPALTERLNAAIRACVNPTLGGPIGRIDLPCRRTGAMLQIEVLRPQALPEGLRLAGGLVPEPAALLLLHHPERQRARRVERLMARHGLTHAEARLAIEIARGDGRAAAARRAGISINTARTHLSAIFAKLGVHRQSELVLLIAEI